MKLSATGQRWVNTMRRMYSHDAIEPVIGQAECIARERGGRAITREDLNEALDTIAQKLVAQDILEHIWG